MNSHPSPDGFNGRDEQGRFAAGNRGGRGNPHAAQVGRLRAAMLESVTPEDIAAIIARLIELAKEGDVRAIKEVLDRTLGKPQEADFIERLEAIEASLAAGGGQ